MPNASISKTNLTNSRHNTMICPPRSIEVGICNLFLRLGDNSPQSKAVFFCLPFLGLLHKFMKQVNSIMTALFWRPLRSVSPSRDIANQLNAVTRLFAKSCDGFTHFRLGITA